VPTQSSAVGDHPPGDASTWRTISTFSWALVDPRVKRALLLADGFDEADLNQNLTDVADQHFGKAGGRSKLKPLAGVLREDWLPLAPARVVKELALTVRHIATGKDRQAPINTKSLALEFLNRRRLNKNLTTNLVSFFLAEHKESVRIEVRPVGSRERHGLRIIEGLGSERPAPWQHQVEARSALDRHLIEHPEQGALVVLPTGAGKTETLVEWLLDRLSEEPSARVLWIVHQQELVDQAITRFAVCGTGRPRGFVRRARAIHGSASDGSTLAEEELDIASVTIQTLTHLAAGRSRSKLAKFLSRPTYVVVDEAHHAASPSYGRVLDLIEVVGTKALVGLTATPWPTSMAAHARLQRRFSCTVINVSPEQLVARRILARSVLHTVSTGLRIHLNSEERRSAEQGDFSSQTLTRLDVDFRNDMVAQQWAADPKRWGKSLVFACNIHHADALSNAFHAVGAEVKVVHSRSENDRKTTLEWFRNSNDAPVLISVGMLNEGVDLPDAATAFLARPTASRILLRQMIGRVLRGPNARGTAEAHIVWFEDGWENFGEVLDPSVVLPIAVRTRIGADGIERELPELLDDLGRDIPLDLEAEIAVRLSPESLPVIDDDLDGNPDEGWVPVDPLLVASRLVGYYQLPDRNLPVFEHQQAAYEELTKTAIDADLRGRSLLSWFDDTHPPYPSQTGLLQLIEYSREIEEVPPFVALDAIVGPSVAVDKILAAGALDEAERHALMRDVYEGSLARATYRTLEFFEQAVEQELRSRRRSSPSLESPVAASLTSGLKKRPSVDRDLKARWKVTLRQAPSLLTPEIRSRLVASPDIEVGWTRRVVSTTWGHWSIRLRGRNIGRQTIRVNRLLRTNAKVAPDALIEYLLYHELLHHLLPGEGHDAEFNELEANWPDRDSLDVLFATFHEQWDTNPDRYKNESAD
jgi:superfamily II DNA or RNA helicase